MSALPAFNRGTNNGYTIAFRGNANDNGANDWSAAQPMCVIRNASTNTRISFCTNPIQKFMSAVDTSNNDGYSVLGYGNPKTANNFVETEKGRNQTPILNSMNNYVLVVTRNSATNKLTFKYIKGTSSSQTSETVGPLDIYGGRTWDNFTPTELWLGGIGQSPGVNNLSHFYVYDRPLDTTEVGQLLGHMSGSGSAPSSYYAGVNISTAPEMIQWGAIQIVDKWGMFQWKNPPISGDYNWPVRNDPTYAGGASIRFPEYNSTLVFNPALGAPQSAAAAITANALTTYISGSTSTTVALATEVRAAIKAQTDATAKAAAKAEYITAMRAKEPTLKIAVPQTDFSTYIATFANVPTAISSAAKPIDVILPSASNVIDITTASVDETKYTALEMPLNTTVTVQDNGSTVGTLTYDGSVYTDGNSNTYNVGDSIVFGTKRVTILGEGSALVEITNTYKSIEINLNVEISANGELNVLGYQPTAPSNIVIAASELPVDALYDSSNGIALIEFWEPDNLDDIEAQLASTQTLGGVQGYKITAKKLALGLQNVLIGELDAKSAEPFNAVPKYGAAGAQNGNRVMTGFGRLALMAYAHYLMGHVQATAAITNDTDFMQGMLSLNSDTLTDYKYANIGNYDAAAAPWSTAGTPSDANLAVRLVKALLDANTSSSLVSNGAANSVANIVKQVIGQDASRATDEDNNKYSPENHGLLRFYPDDIIYVSINLTTPVVNVGTGQLVSDSTLEGLYTNATGDKKYTLKITLGPASA
jgi:hypothetical protein